MTTIPLSGLELWIVDNFIRNVWFRCFGYFLNFRLKTTLSIVISVLENIGLHIYIRISSIQTHQTQHLSAVKNRKLCEHVRWNLLNCVVNFIPKIMQKVVNQGKLCENVRWTMNCAKMCGKPQIVRKCAENGKLCGTALTAFKCCLWDS